ncbi:transcriptional regulator [Candidatus Woesearchaeota archaeon]|nr:transcriptional regulator [Candidatus Woesearchaeota archaeon]
MTRREEIIKLLEKEPTSAQQLANFFKVELFEILGDLGHVRSSIKPRKLKMIPAQCKHCGFKFEERSKIKKPTKCPRCKDERIMAPLFEIE